MTRDADDQSKGSKRLNHLLVAARHAFMLHGYQHVSVDGISRASGVSKETIYRHFADKQALFRAAMQNAAEQFAHDFADIFHGCTSPEAILARCARAIYDRAADIEHPTPNWLVVGTADRFPELSQAVFFDALKSVAPLHAFLDKLARENGVETSVPLTVLAQFGALAVAGPLHIMAGTPPADIDLAARRVARLFIHGYGSDLDDESGKHAPALTFGLPPADPVLPQEEHIAQLMAVARSHFFEHGYRGASLDEIGTVARVGRGTLYRHFGSKKGLFTAVMQKAADNIVARSQVHLSTDRSVVDNLFIAGNAASAILQSREAIQLYRTVSAEAKAMPEVASAIYRRTRARFVQPVAQYLAWCSARNILSLDDPEWAADQFVTLASGGNRYLVLNPPPTDAEREDAARLAISIFLYGFLGREAGAVRSARADQ
ncbi:TetR/AcrR family transcriptional regulator [Sphingomonas sp. C3-2]|uniref:TetR/AcrR family transcriptional regulator n=1 Tax=Sphingomonas sp. C3-2 TaxID=3062169 RepID=UPI00294B458B|nr:TetR/AcrR family transcriptional regulator [Sphingomonas sp. C3-2]WOK35355.1 TetR family transcriptional regulator [Sphingomonas sp. C3-2]